MQIRPCFNAMARKAPHRLTCLTQEPYSDSPGPLPCREEAAAKGGQSDSFLGIRNREGKAKHLRKTGEKLG